MITLSVTTGHSSLETTVKWKVTATAAMREILYGFVLHTIYGLNNIETYRIYMYISLNIAYLAS